MHRFYCQSLSADPSLSAVQLDAKQARHARTVLRLGVGDEVELFNGSGLVAVATIENAEKEPLLRVLSRRQEAPLSPAVDMAVCLPKGARAADMANQLSQLGVSRLIPLRTQRSVVDPGAGKIERLRAAAIESAKQCGRAHVMAIDEPADFGEVIGRDYAVKLLGDPGGEVISTPAGDDTLIVIGPEGGLTDAEREQAAAAGCRLWAFAPHVLRIETAAAAAAAIARVGAGF